jgi:outer membrane protein OmpA-like peptidoglycan-associated protein
MRTRTGIRLTVGTMVALLWACDGNASGALNGVKKEFKYLTNSAMIGLLQQGVNSVDQVASWSPAEEKKFSGILRIDPKRVHGWVARARRLQQDCSANIQNAGSGGIHFDERDDEPNSQSKAVLDRIVDAVRECRSDPRLLVEGHTDNQNVSGSNADLSERRAKFVAGKLVAAGVEAQRLRFIGLTDTRPVAPHDLEAERWRNRRAVVRVDVGDPRL